MTGKKRASVFDVDPEVQIDLSGFAPKPAPSVAGPSAEQVRAVSAAMNFPSREAPAAKSSAKPKREVRRHRTGRNVQFNCKAQQEIIDRFYALCDKNNWVMGYTMERAVSALERELTDQ